MSPSLMARIHGLDEAAQAAARGQPPPTMFERVGGEPAIRSVVTSFYSKVLADREHNEFRDPFKRVSLEHHVEKQVDFLVSAMGGDAERYPGGAKKIMLMHKMFAQKAMNTAGANLWLKHMVAALSEADEVPASLKEPVLEFMNAEMAKYGEQFDFDFTRARL
jgi:hemoglobin